MAKTGHSTFCSAQITWPELFDEMTIEPKNSIQLSSTRRLSQIRPALLDRQRQTRSQAVARIADRTASQQTI